MKCTKYLFTLFIGTLTYVILSILVGQNSITCYKQMEEQKIDITDRTQEIENINNELLMELNALQNDKAVIGAYARKLDYVGEGEKLVKITGLKPAQTTLYDTGTVLYHKGTMFLEEKYCKMLGLILGILSFVIMILYDINKKTFNSSKKQNSVIKGIPIYEIPQV